MEKNIRSADYFRQINMIYAMQMITLAGFSVVILYLSQAVTNNSIEKEVQYLLAALLIAGMIASQQIPRVMLKKIDPALELRYKVPKYFPIAIIRVACFELSGLIAGIATFLTGQQYFLLIVPLLLIVMLIYRPTRSQVAADLNLSMQEKNLLDNPETLLTQQVKGK
jgi:hypothetical protein